MLLQTGSYSPLFRIIDGSYGMNGKIYLVLFLLLGDVVAQETADYLIFSDTPRESSVKEVVIFDTLQSIIGSERSMVLNTEELDGCLPEKFCFEYINDQYPTFNILKVDFFEQDQTTYLILSMWDQIARKLTSSKSIVCSDCTTFEIINLLSEINLNSLETWNDDDYTLLIEPSVKYTYNQKETFNQRYYTINISPKPAANVFINNFDYGSSPIEVSSDKKQTIKVELKNNQHETYIKSMTFGKDKKLTTKLKALVANLRIASDPGGAKVIVDGRERGKTGRNKTVNIKNILLNQTIEIKLQLKNYIDNEVTWSPPKKGDNYLKLDLERGTGFLRIQRQSGVKSEDIKVEINGVPRGTLSSHNQDTLTLNAGNNTIVLKHKDAVRKEKFDIPLEDTKDWKVNFMEKADITITF